MMEEASNNERAIVDTVRTYVEAMCAGDETRLALAWHDRTCSIGHFDGKLEWDDRAAFAAAVQAAVTEPVADPHWRIHETRIVGDMAFVHVEDDWLGLRFDDFLTLLHHDGRWLIVSKVFHLRGPA
jgi:hypothetical protein